MSAILLLLESTLIAAVLTAWCRVSVTPAEQLDAAAVPMLIVASIAIAAMLIARLVYSWVRRKAERGWWGLDAIIRQAGTPLSIGAAGALVAWSVWRASDGEKLGGAGSLLVLMLITVVGLKLVAETYLFAQLGTEPSPRQDSARRLIGPLSFQAKARYTLGALGGIILPLGAQLLAGGSKNIPAVVDASPPAILAVMAFVCLLPGELLERRLFWSDKTAVAPRSAEPTPIDSQTA